MTIWQFIALYAIAACLTTFLCALFNVTGRRSAFPPTFCGALWPIAAPIILLVIFEKFGYWTSETIECL